MPVFDGIDEYDGVFKSICKKCGVKSDRIDGLNDYYNDIRFRQFRNSLPSGAVVFASKRMKDNAEVDVQSLNANEQEAIEQRSAFSVSASIYEHIYELMRYDFLHLHYIGPYRNNPERAYRGDDTRHADVGINGEYTSSVLINDYQSDGQIIEKVRGWLKVLLSLGIDVNEIGGGFYQIKINKILEDGQVSVSSNITDVGYGVSQVLPIVTQIAEAQIESESWLKAAFPEIYVVEQPELHLHPNAQAELAKLFASIVQDETEKNRKLLIETHSEHFIRGLQTLIANVKSEYHIPMDFVKIYYVHDAKPGCEDGSWL